MNFSAQPLTDPSGSSTIASGVAWVQGVALGTTATVIAVIAVAAIGLLMLSGRLELRRGITVVMGCFILFGAPNIAVALTGLGSGDRQPRLPATPDPASLSSRSPASETSPPSAYDPYAGASLPSRQ